MPDNDCYREIGRDIGELRGKVESMQRAQAFRDKQLDERLASIESKLDAINTDRSRLDGVIWSVRIIFGGLIVVIGWLATNGFPSWFKRLM